MLKRYRVKVSYKIKLKKVQGNLLPILCFFTVIIKMNLFILLFIIEFRSIIELL